MAYKCYHCEHETESAHSITLYNGNDERFELLCDTCYADWLLSLKG